MGIAVGVFAATRANNNEKNTEQIKETETTISATFESHNHIYTVPDTVGMEYEEALSLLKKAGFTVESEEEYNDKIEYGHVVKQSIQAGEQFEKPQVIVIFVSKGEENKDKDTSDDSSKNSNSNNSSGNNTNGEYSDYNYGNSTVDDGVHDEENSLNSDNSSNGESSKNDDSVSNDMSQDQSSYEHGEEDGGGMNGGDAAAPDQYGLPFIAD